MMLISLSKTCGIKRNSTAFDNDRNCVASSDLLEPYGTAHIDIDLFRNFEKQKESKDVMLIFSPRALLGFVRGNGLEFGTETRGNLILSSILQVLMLVSNFGIMPAILRAVLSRLHRLESSTSSYFIDPEWIKGKDAGLR